jgi:hypothetical protein
MGFAGRGEGNLPRIVFHSFHEIAKWTNMDGATLGFVVTAASFGITMPVSGSLLGA